MNSQERTAAAAAAMAEQKDREARTREIEEQIRQEQHHLRGVESSAALDRPLADAGDETSRWHVGRAERSAARIRARIAALEAQLPQQRLGVR